MTPSETEAIEQLQLRAMMTGDRLVVCLADLALARDRDELSLAQLETLTLHGWGDASPAAAAGELLEQLRRINDTDLGGWLEVCLERMLATDNPHSVQMRCADLDCRIALEALESLRNRLSVRTSLTTEQLLAEGRPWARRPSRYDRARREVLALAKGGSPAALLALELAIARQHTDH